MGKSLEIAVGRRVTGLGPDIDTKTGLGPDIDTKTGLGPDIDTKTGLGPDIDTELGGEEWKFTGDRWRHKMSWQEHAR